MNLEARQIWQIAAGEGGDSNRNYVDVLLEWDVVAVGPGNEGPWPGCVPALRERVSDKKLADLKRFNENLKDGDIIVLRLGTTDVYGVGIAIGSALWLDDFGDIDGWDLQFIRRVKWIWKYSGSPQKFPTYSMKLGDTVQILDGPIVLEWVKGLESSTQPVDHDIKRLPASCVDSVRIEPSDPVAVANYLFDNGVGANSIDSLMDEIAELRRIAQWYQRTGLQISEDETRAYLIVPLLRALGWSPQKMAVEWNYVDVALFEKLPRKNENLVAVVEAKRIGSSLLNSGIRTQAKGYAEQDGRIYCKRLVVTDGLRYAVYARGADEPFPDRPQAYFSLTWFKSSYPIVRCQGVQEALAMMAPDWSYLARSEKT